MPTPIIFCHYGNTEYLKYSLKCAKFNNPGCEIFLLGDQYNKIAAEKCGITHVFFNDLNYGNEIRLFDAIYKLIQGRLHEHMRGGRDWVKFVFKRWFFTYNFISRRNTEAFWHFDSDNMILDDLERHKEKFRRYDCTEQCGGMCMNGYVTSHERGVGRGFSFGEEYEVIIGS